MQSSLLLGMSSKLYILTIFLFNSIICLLYLQPFENIPQIQMAHNSNPAMNTSGAVSILNVEGPIIMIIIFI